MPFSDSGKHFLTKNIGAALSMAALSLLSVQLSHAQTVSLGNALDNNNLEWKTYSEHTTVKTEKVPDSEEETTTTTTETKNTNGWYGQTSTRRDEGSSAAQSGKITAATGLVNSKSILETTVSGKGTLTFWYKVSSNSICHHLRFFIVTNGTSTNHLTISGEGSWAQLKYTITENAVHTLRWVYEKEEGPAMSSDAAWLDEVVWTPEVKPALTVTPATFNVSALAQQIIIDVKTGSWWTATSDAKPPPVKEPDEPAEGEPGEEPETPEPPQPWLRVPLDPTQGNGTITADIDANEGEARTAKITVKVYGITRTVTVTQAPGGEKKIELANALRSSLDWNNTGDADWFGQNAPSRNKTTGAAQSGPVGDGKASKLQTTVYGPGILTFFWKVSSAPNVGVLGFAINGAEQQKISGATDWIKRTYTLPAGPYSLEWIYKKDGDASIGHDAGWLDQVTWQPLFDVYETKVSARTSTIKEMSVKVSDDTKPKKIHYRAPVSKNYTIIMAYEREADGSRVVEDDGLGNIIYTGKGYGRMWSSDADKAFTFGGEYFSLNGEAPDTAMSPVGAKGQNIPVNVLLRSASLDAPQLNFQGLATLELIPRLGRILTYNGAVHGTDIPPATCTISKCAAPRTPPSPPTNLKTSLSKAEQGYLEFGVEEVTSGMIPGIYYPQPCLDDSASQPAHFVGTFTTRYNAAMAKKAELDWELLRTLINTRIPKVEKR